MRTIVWLIGIFALVAICIMVVSDEASATRQAQTLDLTVPDVIENTTQSAEAQITWIGGGLWDGVVSFEWYNTTGHEVFQEDITPDGVGYVLSNYAPDWLGTWHVNASFTGTNPVYDNESFTVVTSSIHIINNGITNITWNDAVAVEAVFSDGQAYIGQDQGIKLVVTNSSSDDPIKGVGMALSVVTTEGETAIGYTVVGETNTHGELHHVFDIPVDSAIENRFMEVVVNIHDVDYSDINGWLYTGRHAFYVGYFIEFTNDSAHPVVDGNLNALDYVLAEMNYTMNYTEAVEAHILYQFINTTTNCVMHEDSMCIIFNPHNLYTTTNFQIPMECCPGLTRIDGFIEILIPNTQESIQIYRKTENFTVVLIDIITYHSTPFSVDFAAYDVGEGVGVSINRTILSTVGYDLAYTFIERNGGEYRYPIGYKDGIGRVGNWVYTQFFEIPTGLKSGEYSISCRAGYEWDDVEYNVEFNSTYFTVNCLVAMASSDIDVFTNYTQLALDGSESHGYNDSYWGVRWTSTYAPGRMWHGLEPVMIINVTGTYVVTLNVTDGMGNYSELSFDVSAFVSPVEHMPNTRPIIIGYPETTVAIGAAYEVDFDFVDVDSPPQTIVFYLSTNATWLALNSTTGVLSGTAQAGIYSVSISTIDDWGATDTYAYTLTVASSTVVEESANATLQIVMSLGVVIVVLIMFAVISKFFRNEGEGELP